MGMCVHIYRQAVVTRGFRILDVAIYYYIEVRGSLSYPIALPGIIIADSLRSPE